MSGARLTAAAFMKSVECLVLSVEILLQTYQQKRRVRLRTNVQAVRKRTLHCASGIRTQILEERRLFAEFLERPRDVDILLMAFDVDVKQILPAPGARRPRFEPGHADAVEGKRRYSRLHP